MQLHAVYTQRERVNDLNRHINARKLLVFVRFASYTFDSHNRRYFKGIITKKNKRYYTLNRAKRKYSRGGVNDQKRHIRLSTTENKYISLLMRACIKKKKVNRAKVQRGGGAPKKDVMCSCTRAYSSMQ